MRRPPFFTLDLLASGLLPENWNRAIAALAGDDARNVILPSEFSPQPAGETWSFATVAGDVLRDRCPWLPALYLGPLRAFAERSFGGPVFVEQRLRSAMSLHILTGAGAGIEWHAHAGMVNGLLFVTSADGTGAGDLVFRDGDGREQRVAGKAGTFVCFDGATEHCVTPLQSAGPRLTIPLIYFASAAEQRPAYGADIYL